MGQRKKMLKRQTKVEWQYKSYNYWLDLEKNNFWLKKKKKRVHSGTLMLRIGVAVPGSLFIGFYK